MQQSFATNLNFLAACSLLMCQVVAPHQSSADEPQGRADGKSSVNEAAAGNENPTDGDGSKKSPKRELFSGKVVLLRDALKKRKITAFSEFDGQVVLETPRGELIPIVPDWRGRAFYQDKRLRDREVDLVAYRREGLPYIQVLMIFTFDEKHTRQYTDYWCDICSIPMYEIKACDCCQGDIRLRFQEQQLPDYVSPKGVETESGKGEPASVKP